MEDSMQCDSRLVGLGPKAIVRNIIEVWQTTNASVTSTFRTELYIYNSYQYVTKAL